VVKRGKQERSFLKKRTKKLFRPCTRASRLARTQTEKSLFASFSSEKEEPYLEPV
jgi:hypothetical protein